MAVDLRMYRKGLDAKKTYYQILKEEEEANQPNQPNQINKPLPLDPVTGQPMKRKRGHPRKIDNVDNS